MPEGSDLGRREVGDVDLFDRLDEERRFRKDLDVDQTRGGLERDGLEFLASMHPDGRKGVRDRNGEQESIG
jgi:hypothetical protein